MRREGAMMGRVASISVDPRPLSCAECAVLECVLSAEFVGAAQLRAQLNVVEVVAVWSQGSVSVDLRVPVGCPRAAVGDGPLPVVADVSDGSGVFVGEIVVWVSGGALSALEYAWVTDLMPRELPSPGQMLVRAGG